MMRRTSPRWHAPVTSTEDAPKACGRRSGRGVFAVGVHAALEAHGVSGWDEAPFATGRKRISSLTTRDSIALLPGVACGPLGCCS